MSAYPDPPVERDGEFEPVHRARRAEPAGKMLLASAIVLAVIIAVIVLL